MESKTIDVVDFSRDPGGRLEDDGPYSGEVFRRTILVPALRESERVTVVLDGTSGYGSSFLEEAFGGLIREEGFSQEELGRRLSVVAMTKQFEFYRDRVHGYIKAAKPKPKVH